MATLILRDTYIILEDEMKSIDKLRAETASQIQEAASHGDLKENYEYKAAKEKMEFVVYKKQLLQSYGPFRFIEFNKIKAPKRCRILILFTTQKITFHSFDFMSNFCNLVVIQF